MSGLAPEVVSQRFRLDWTADMNDAVTALQWEADGDLLTGDASGDINRFTPAGERIHYWHAHNGAVLKVCPKPTGQCVATSGEDGSIRLWDSTGGIMQVLVEGDGWIEQLAWKQDGQWLGAATGKKIYQWDDTNACEAWYQTLRNIQAMAWSPSGMKLALAVNKGVFLWAPSDKQPRELMSFPGAAISLAWKPDGSALAAGTQDGFLHVWRRQIGANAKLLTMRGYQGKVSCLEWHPLKDTIATAGGKDIVIWGPLHQKGGGSPLPVAHHRTTITCLSYEPSGYYLASGDRDGLVCIWDGKGKLVQQWQGHHEITVLRWDAEGNRLITGDTHGRLNAYMTNTELS